MCRLPVWQPRFPRQPALPRLLDGSDKAFLPAGTPGPASSRNNGDAARAAAARVGRRGQRAREPGRSRASVFVLRAIVKRNCHAGLRADVINDSAPGSAVALVFFDQKGLAQSWIASFSQKAGAPASSDGASNAWFRPGGQCAARLLLFEQVELAGDSQPL